MNGPSILPACFLATLIAMPAPGQALFADATPTHLPQDAALHSLDAEFGDFDKDGDLDIAVAVEGGTNRLYLNDGRAAFTHKAGVFSATAADGEDLAVEDFDRDGNLDVIFVMEDGGVHQYHLGNGDATFRDVSDRIPRCQANGVEAADLDKDGWTDVLIACAGGGPGAQDLLLINDRKGSFADETAARLPALTESSQDIKAADLDGDGDLDIVVGNENQKNRLLLNDGQGRFADVTGAVMPAGATGRLWDVEAADLDKDGTLDVFMGAWGTQAILMLGTVKQPAGIRKSGKPGKRRTGSLGPGWPASGPDGKPFHGSHFLFPWRSGFALSDGRSKPSP